ncbi:MULTISPECIES: beta propeller repeat protein [Variovorax]|uniref:hypothetical protein n=1 Tax=Variovorax TaxID=34072 RepID=UPI00180349C0|nr:hypothetical protein [Variovorax sp. BK613]MBB3639980.1 hypothetical protein [Variovorax sp. BK613]
MPEKVSISREFVRGAARMADLVYVISQMKTLIEQDIAHVSLVGLYKGNWGDAFNTTWNATAIAVAKSPAEKVVLVGEDGEVSTYVGGRREDEAIDPRPVMVRHAREIGGEVFVCGSKRQVFRRIGEGQWLDMSAPRAGQTEVFGFEAIDGYGWNEIYAAGWAGEIWRHDGTAWTRCGSPTNVILSAVCCAGDGLVYVAGQGGVLVKGRGDAWAPVAWEDEVDADLWDLCWFRDELYVATMSGLYTLDANRLVPVDFGAMGPVSCYNLSVAQGVMWSVGKADVASFDGTTWRKYD